MESYQNNHADLYLKTSSDVEMTTLYAAIPQTDLGSVNSANDQNDHTNICMIWIQRIIKLIFLVFLCSELMHFVSHNRSKLHPVINPLAKPDIYLDDDLQNVQSEDKFDGSVSHDLSLGRFGLEGLTLDHIQVKKITSLLGKEKNSTIHKFICFLNSDESHLLATGSLEKNAGGNGWAYLSVSSFLPNHQNSTNVNNVNSMLRRSSDYLSKKSTKLESKGEQDDILNTWLQARVGMGFLEGYTTCSGILDWYANSYQAQFDGGDPNEDILRFLESNHDWMIKQANAHWRHSDYWLSIKGRLAQLHGLLAGVRAGCPGTDDKPFKDIPIIPRHGNTLQDFDGHRVWIGQSRAENKYTYHYKSPNLDATSGGIFLSNMERNPSLIHLLIINANGDLYQIGDKFNIFADKPLDTDSKRKNRKRDETKKYMLKNHTLHDQDDDVADDDGDFSKSKWGREMRELSGPLNENAFQSKYLSHRHRRALSNQHKRKLVQTSVTSENSLLDEVDEPYIVGDHCSALVKLLPNFSDILFGHNTWDDYQNAFPRIFKTYEYPRFRNGTVEALHRTDFSSSPGILASIDDFYIAKTSGDSHLGVIETSIDIYNRTYLEYIKPESMLAWIRVVTANELAATGEAWSKVFSLFASGTYMDQWMVIDFNKFNPGFKPSNGLFTVLEEMPGHIHWEDMTQHLVEHTYWASYNNPFFKDIRDMTGQTALCIKNSIECYATDPRGLMFHDLQRGIKNVSDLLTVMQYNHWQTDALSMNNSCKSIACRGDLEIDLSLWAPHGAIDAKVSSYLSVLPQENRGDLPVVYAKLGPTVDNQAPFCWKQFENVTDMSGRNIKHRSHPECFNYDWILMPRIV